MIYTINILCVKTRQRMCPIKNNKHGHNDFLRGLANAVSKGQKAARPVSSQLQLSVD